MTITAIILLLISAFTHAGWNLLGKRNDPTAASFLVAIITGTLCFFPFLVVYRMSLGLFSLRVWLFVIGAGCFQTIFYTALVGAYQTGDLSIAYPLARSSPVIMVMVVNFLLGRKDQISWQCIWGMVLIVGGGLLLPMKRFSDFRLQNYRNLSCLLALLAAVGTTGYSLIDDAALRLLRQTPGILLPSWEITLLYAFFEAVTSSFWLSLVVCGRKREREILRKVITTSLHPAAFMGIGIGLAYTLALISMAFVTNVSYVVAFRQLSIPLGVILGASILKEPSTLPKFAGVTVMFVGLALVGTG